MNMLSRLAAIVLLCFLWGPQVHAAGQLDPVSARYVELLSNGGPPSIRDAAQGIHRGGISDERVLDVAAEVLLRDYKTAVSGGEVDALAWVTNALSNAKTSRYNSVLEEVAKNAAHRKLAKYAKKNLNKRLPEAPQYVAGTVALDKVAKQTQAAPSKPAASTAKTGQYHPISIIKAGMSRQEVIDLVGPPTATHSYPTGKAFNPFNVRGGDVMREDALYKGQGRIVFSNDSAYSTGWRVVEVRLDPNESGYP